MPSQQAHVTVLNDLDSSRLSLAKAISDAEAALASKDAELSALREEARQLEEYDPAAEHEKELDGTTYVARLYLLVIIVDCYIATRLRLAIFKGMGFEPIMNKHSQVTKMLVRKSGLYFCYDPGTQSIPGSQSGDIHAVDVATGKRNAEYTENIWKVAMS